MRKIIGLLVFASVVLLGDSTKEIQMYSSPTCGCCEEWAKYMRTKGYQVKSHKDDELFMKVKEDFKIVPKYQSCHTGIIEKNGVQYAIEGHVPADAVEWLLENQPKEIIGVSTPGMPLGSPGMEQGDDYEEYPVVLMTQGGGYKVFGIYKGEKKLKSGNVK
ncbi:DUF411 domain-containing protein [Helicobacter sp.]|uniref:DUF411 domain-containing protein n=1 Tax=Helicobacter sp. TaxID=218 RepID=UPI0019982A46|nr:DUF411 domain-containing protein [Helicobacter sp.]MBD5165168.1 DUF411 domain-containing protein [Helicobacter sp.]